MKIQSMFYKEMVIQRFCKLSEKVMKDIYNYEYPADCFCGENKIPDEHFIFSENIMRFIEDAVNTSIMDEQMFMDETITEGESFSKS